MDCIDCRLDDGVKVPMESIGFEQVKRFRTTRGEVEPYFVSYELFRCGRCKKMRRFIVPSRVSGNSVVSSVGFMG